MSTSIVTYTHTLIHNSRPAHEMRSVNYGTELDRKVCKWNKTNMRRDRVEASLRGHWEYTTH